MVNKKKCLKPVFILGAGRSGTKFLRGLLASSEEVVEVPYDVGYIWRYGNEGLSHDELTSDMVTDEISDYIRRTLPKLANYKSNIEPKYLLEKSVPNSLRPEFLYRVFPDALFIHLIRDGRAVTESAIRLWKSPPEKGYLLKKLRYFPLSNYRYAIWYIWNMIKGKFFSKRGQFTWGPRYDGLDVDIENESLEVVCARQWKRCVETSLSQLSSIPSDQVFEIRYEDLMTNPDSLKMLCNFLCVKDVNNVVQQYKKTIRTENLGKWREKLNDESLRLINGEIAVLLDELGYK